MELKIVEFIRFEKGEKKLLMGDFGIDFEEGIRGWLFLICVWYNGLAKGG